MTNRLDGDGHGQIRSALSAFCPAEDDELADLTLMRELAASAEPFDRTSPFHLTASTLIVDPPTRRVLLRWHGRHHQWMQVGGHGDPGEFSPYLIALREAREESGLADLFAFPAADPAVVQVVVVEVPANDTERAHRHGDVRYLMACANPEGIQAESSETPLRWCSLAEARNLISEENLTELLDRTERIFDRLDQVATGS